MTDMRWRTVWNTTVRGDGLPKVNQVAVYPPNRWVGASCFFVCFFSCCRPNKVCEQWAMAYDSWQPKRTEQTLLSIVDKVDAILPVYSPHITIEQEIFANIKFSSGWTCAATIFTKLYVHLHFGVHVGQRKFYWRIILQKQIHRVCEDCKKFSFFRPTVIFLTTSFILRPSPHTTKLADCNIASTWWQLIASFPGLGVEGLGTRLGNSVLTANQHTHIYSTGTKRTRI